MVATTTGRSFAAGHFGLIIDGAKVSAYIKSVEGGFPKANLTDEAIGTDPLHVKHLSTREIEPFQVEVGLSGSKSVLMWIQDSWQKKFSRHNGQCTHADFNKMGRFEQHFTNALIMETAFPTLDGSTKEPGYLKVKFLAEQVELKQNDGPRILADVAANQKMWHNHAFRFRIDGVDMSKASKIDGFTIKQGVKALHTGAALFPELEPTKVEFPDLSVHLSLQFANPAMNWYNETVRRGAKDPSVEKTGAIEFLTPDLRTVIFTVKLKQVGIKNFSINRSEGAQEAIKRAKVDLYVGEMELVPGPGL
jgi:hypothetical protein